VVQPALLCTSVPIVFFLMFFPHDELASLRKTHHHHSLTPHGLTFIEEEDFE
jgi:hypothetical protein